MEKAIILVNILNDSETTKTIDEIKKISGTIQAYTVYGVYDVVVIVEALDMNKLKEIVTYKIKKLPNIRSTLTMIAVNDYSGANVKQ